MSELKELIETLCPDGVEWKTLGEVTGISRGSRLTKKELTDKGIPVYHGSLSPLGYYDKSNREGDTVIVVNTGGIGGVGYSEKEFWCSDGCFTIDRCERLNSRFLYHYLCGFKSYFISKIRTGGVPTIEKSTVTSIEIPLPPLEVQKETARILDTFTELETELELRLKQYSYYRDKLLTFGDDVERKKLGEIFTRIKGTPITAGTMKQIASPDGDIIIYAGGKTVVNAFEKDIEKANITRVPAVLIQSRGVIDAIYCDKPFTFKNEM